MSSGETLFERLRRAADPQAAPARDTRSALIASIQRNLQRILSSRQGHAPAQMDYGIPAPNEIASLSGDGVESMQKLLRSAIQRFEPRLTDVSVAFVETENAAAQLRFAVRARLAAMPESGPVLLDTIVGTDGQMKVKP